MGKENHLPTIQVPFLGHQNVKFQGVGEAGVSFFMSISLVASGVWTRVWLRVPRSAGFGGAWMRRRYIYNCLFCFLGKFLSTLGTFWHVLTCLFLFSPFFQGFADWYLLWYKTLSTWFALTGWLRCGEAKPLHGYPSPKLHRQNWPTSDSCSSYPPNKETMQPFGKEIYKPNLENIFFLNFNHSYCYVLRPVHKLFSPSMSYAVNAIRFNHIKPSCMCVSRHCHLTWVGECLQGSGIRTTFPHTPHTHTLTYIRYIYFYQYAYIYIYIGSTPHPGSQSPYYGV